MNGVRLPHAEYLSRARRNAKEYARAHPDRIKAQQQQPGRKAQNRANSMAQYERLRDYLQSLKSQSGGCLDCGYKGDVTLLHFHHRLGTKKFKDVARMNGYSKAKVDVEIAKCDILCRTCHEARHTPKRRGAPRGSS